MLASNSGGLGERIRRPRQVLSPGGGRPAHVRALWSHLSRGFGSRLRAACEFDALRARPAAVWAERRCLGACPRCGLRHGVVSRCEVAVGVAARAPARARCLGWPRVWRLTRHGSSRPRASAFVAAFTSCASRYPCRRARCGGTMPIPGSEGSTTELAWRAPRSVGRGPLGRRRGFACGRPLGSEGPWGDVLAMPTLCEISDPRYAPVWHTASPKRWRTCSRCPGVQEAGVWAQRV